MSFSRHTNARFPQLPSAFDLRRFVLGAVLEAAALRGPPQTIFLCTASWSAGAFSTIALGHIISPRSRQTGALRIVVGDPGPDAALVVRRLMMLRGDVSEEAIRGIVRSPRSDGDLPPLHAKFISLRLSSGAHLAIVGSSNASFAGYLENCELNVGFFWRFGDPYGFQAMAEHLWSSAEPLTVAGQTQELSTLGRRLKPRTWQRSRICALRAVWHAVKRNQPRPAHELTGYTLAMPPATGKTLIAVEFSRTVLASGGRVLWLAHRRVLLTQAMLTIRRQVGASQGERVMQVLGTRDHFDPPCICLATDAMLACRLKSVAHKVFDLIVVDEVHRYGATRYAAILRQLRGKVLLGLSATPARRGRGRQRAEFEARFPRSHALMPLPMGLAFRLSEQGRPVLARVRHVSFDTGWVMRVPSDDPWTLEAEERRQLGEFSTHFTTVVLAVLEALFTRYASEIGSFGPTLVFAANIAHAQRLDKGLTALLAARGRPSWVRQYHSGIPIHVRGRTRTAELELLREEFLGRAGSGESPMLIGVDIIAEGFDVPAVQTLVMSRPTVSLRLYAQMIGRGLRGPAMGGGDYCNILHFGAQTELGSRRRRSFVDVRDVLSRDSSRIQSLSRLEHLLREDRILKGTCESAQATLERRRARRH